MRDILWISLRAPYEKVSHAGGKTHFFYLRSFLETKEFNINLVSFCYERENANYEAEKLRSKIYVINRNEKVRDVLGKLGLPISLMEYPFVKKSIYNELLSLKKEKYVPDIIILHWTEIIMLIRKVKQIFPTSKIVVIEEDVTFLKMMRKLARARGIGKIVTWIQKELIQKRELRGLKNADMVVLNNKKDYKLVRQHGMEEKKCLLTVPYFDNWSNISRKPEKNNILFWGAMNRPENIEAVNWFIEEVFPYIPNIVFYVVGANPPETIKKLECKNIIVTGFVDNPMEYFEKCLCMVVPLKMGAGIKIKVLEGMSAGIPVLTNEIGIEGIDAENEISYLHCETAEDYIKAINDLVLNEEYGNKIGINSKKRIDKMYNLNKDIFQFIQLIKEL